MHSLLRLTAKSKIEARPPGQFCEAELKLTNYDGDVFTGCSLVELNEPEAARIVSELCRVFPDITRDLPPATEDEKHPVEAFEMENSHA